MSSGVKLGLKVAGSLTVYLITSGALDKVVNAVKEKVKENKIKREGVKVTIDDVVYYAELL